MSRHALFRIASSIGSIAVVVLVAFSYGYVEALCERGYAVAIFFGICLMWRRKYSFLPMILTIIHGSSISPDYGHALWGPSMMPRVQLGSFIGLLLWSLFMEQGEEDDTLVKFRPYEEEIRQFLLEKDPSLLSRVDSLLIKYKGKERQLLQKLKAKYSVGTVFSSPLRSPF